MDAQNISLVRHRQTRSLGGEGGRRRQGAGGVRKAEIEGKSGGAQGKGGAEVKRKEAREGRWGGKAKDVDGEEHWGGTAEGGEVRW